MGSSRPRLRNLLFPSRIQSLDRSRKALKPAMYGIEESDGDIVATKIANKGRPAEQLERRPPPEEKRGESTPHHAQKWKCVSHGFKQLRQRCRHVREYDPSEEPEVFTRTPGSTSWKQETTYGSLTEGESDANAIGPEEYRTGLLILKPKLTIIQQILPII